MAKIIKKGIYVHALNKSGEKMATLNTKTGNIWGATSYYDPLFKYQNKQKKTIKKIAVKHVKILRAEGPIHLVNKKWNTFKTLRSANTFLHQGSFSVGSGADKHDFIVTFKNGTTYKGRYDLHHGEKADIGKQMKQVLKSENTPRSKAFLKKFTW